MLTSRVPEVLGALCDGAQERDCLAFYRPSFGRGQSPACFGEVDTILASPSHAYLIEAKWDNGGRSNAGHFTVDETQVLRNKILRWLIERWHSNKPASWSNFRTAHADAFSEAFAGKRLAADGTQLADNLQFLLARVGDRPRQVMDVLLFFVQRGHPHPLGVSPPHFRLVTLEYGPLAPSGFVQSP